MRIFLISLLSLALPAIALSQEPEEPRTIEFSGATWTVVAGDVRLDTHLGQEAVLFRNGGILLDDVDFENGTIEFDVATTGVRSFVGVVFRFQERDEYEFYYLRPHQSGRFDAMQYTPVFNGISAWQLYPEYNANAEIPRNEWLHVRMVISGSRLRVYLGDAEEPALDVDRLRRGRGHGPIGISANFPGAADAPELYPTAFANVSVQRDDAPAVYDEVFTPAPDRFVRRWAISPAFPAPEGAITEIPELPTEDWTIGIAEWTGLLNIARHRSIPEDAQRGAILARLLVRSDRPQTKKLDFGFSDEGSIFLNGEIIFSANNTYLSRSGRYLGVVTIDNDAIYLPLRQGTNELVFAVSEAFGGWGLVARFADMEGISLEAAHP